MSMDLNLEVEGLGEASRFLKELGRQAPYATSVAINDVLTHAQREIQNSLGARFQLRRPDFVKRTIKRDRSDFATKARLVGALRVDPDPKRNFLAQHEEGGEKTPKSGQHLAIPLNVRRNKSEIVSRTNYPRALLDRNGFSKFSKQGRLYLARRTGRGRSARLSLQYLFVRSVRLQPRLGFHVTAQRAIDAHWPVAVESAITKALRTAR